MQHSLQLLLVGLLSFIKVGSVLADTRSFTLNVANREVNPDGHRRSATVANGIDPGPVISGFKGDKFRINVVNNLKDESMLRTTSIHWHGVYMETSAWADGVASITQCPIIPGQSFLYEFSVPSQAGTFWWHSHDSTQYCDGLRGPLIIYDKKDPHRNLYDVDDESTIISLSDWYNVTALSQHNLAPPISRTTLINGKGRYVGGPQAPLSVINVRRNKRYRLRIISMSCDPNFKFSIDGHRMQIIEVETENVRPYWVDSLQIFAGQRYSAILAANQPIGNYWIRSEPNINHGPQGFEGGINSAILRYVGAPIADPTTTAKVDGAVFKELDLHPLSNPRAPGKHTPGGADVNLKLFYSFDQTIAKYRINDVPFEHPTTPVLLQILSGSKLPQELLPAGSVYTLPKNKVIELEISGSGQGLHPFHLHGHTFSVVRSAGSAVYNFVDPVRRDTVNVGVGSAGDVVALRFVTDNSGPWFLHCHIDWHLDLGLAVVMAEDAPGIRKEEHPSKQWDKLCPLWDVFEQNHNARRELGM